MATSIFVPKKINVGFRERDDTYTKKLAYVIYFDEKGKLRKEASWNGWRDKKIDNEIYDNEPTSGFVLNKKAGGYSSGWNHRQTYVRVYDPRGFEFEITVPNLLYILENATSTKGKGLEGEFVYGWDGKDLILVPTESPDYQEIVELNKLRHTDTYIKAKDLKVGATYLTKQNEKLIFMGKFDEYNYNGEKSKTKSLWFHYAESNYRSFVTMKSTSGKVISCVSEECAENYADLFEDLEKYYKYSPVDHSLDEYVPYTLEEIVKVVDDRGWKYVWSQFEGEGWKKTEIERERNYATKEVKIRYYATKQVERRSWYSKPYMVIERFYEYVDTIEEAFNIVKPHYRKVFLANGKLYEVDKQ